MTLFIIWWSVNSFVSMSWWCVYGVNGKYVCFCWMHSIYSKHALEKSGWENEQEDGKEEEEEKKPPMISNAMIFTCIDGYRWFDWSDWLHHNHIYSMNDFLFHVYTMMMMMVVILARLNLKGGCCLLLKFSFFFFWLLLFLFENHSNASWLPPHHWSKIWVIQ